MTDSNDMKENEHDPTEYVPRHPSSTCQWTDFTKIGITLVLLEAAILVLRDYLPRWIFAKPSALSLIWPVTIFLSYALMGSAALICVHWVDNWLNKRDSVPLWKRMLIGAAVIVKATGVIALIAVPALSHWLAGGTPFLIAMWMMSSGLGALTYICFILYRASEEQQRNTLRLQREAEMLNTALARAELAMIEAQIEPHFLFNTLAHIKRQYRINASEADHMLSVLINYLERAMPALQSADWTLNDELCLIQVYLDILVHRFGGRLRFFIIAADMERTIRIPALTVTSLVENAVRHGLAPKIEGGSISIQTSNDENALLIEVCDDGVGLQYSAGTGLGLATVRARLRSVFGNQATLLIEQRQTGGVRAAIRIPIET
jgi:hypothetical protein